MQGIDSKSIKVLVIEDEVLIAERINIYLTERGHTMCCNAICYDEAVKCYEEKKPDVILLDVKHYGEKTGIDFAKYLINNGHETPFVFLTSQYDNKVFLEAVSTKPAGYLAKPIQKESLWTTIELAYYNSIKKIDSNEDRMIQLSDGTKSYVFEEYDILYLSADHIYTDVITLTHGTISVRESLSSLIQRLNPYNFIQCHRSYVINAHYVSSWLSSKINIKNNIIPISRSRKDDVVDLLNKKYILLKISSDASAIQNNKQLLRS